MSKYVFDIPVFAILNSQFPRCFLGPFNEFCIHCSSIAFDWNPFALPGLEGKSFDWILLFIDRMATADASLLINSLILGYALNIYLLLKRNKTLGVFSNDIIKETFPYKYD